MATYAELRKQGPFPGQIDPWAEAGRFFQQIHAGMIGHLLEQIQDPLESMGFLAGRETSLQIAERREPDLYIQQADESPLQPIETWDYGLAAVEVLAEPGVLVEGDPPELDGLHIIEEQSGRLVTVVEIVSPRNKIDVQMIRDYRERRDRLLRKGVNIVEIDPTRSVKRLLHGRTVDFYAYHVAVYLPLQEPRLIGIDFGEPLSRIALPLIESVVPMELQAAYDYSYQVARIAVHILEEERYAEADLPFPTLLTNKQRDEALKAVQVWQAELERLRST